MRRFFAFLLKRYPLLLFILLEAAAISMVVSFNTYQKASFRSGVSDFTGGTYEAWKGITGYFGLKRKNRELAEENARLRSNLQGSFRASDKQIFVWNDTLYTRQFQYVSAQVVNATVNRKKNYLMINKGSNQGIEQDMGVFSSEGVVGMVKSVSRNFALIIPIVNIDANIAARLQKNDQKGIVTWNGQHFRNGTMHGIPGHIPIAKGDTVITSGQSIFFPEGLPIGTVAGFEKNLSDNFYTIKVRFAVDFNSLNYVYVIRNLMAEEQLNLLKMMDNEQ
ncbi:MAG: rod shape-determining protein MreC [Bacteroidales bacterium]